MPPIHPNCCSCDVDDSTEKKLYPDDHLWRLVDDTFIPVKRYRDAIEQVEKETGLSPDSWKTNEQRRLKELLGVEYGHVNEDILRIRATSLRKNPRSGLRGSSEVRGKPKRGAQAKILSAASPRFSQRYLDHLKSADYAAKKDIVYKRCGGQCQCCAEPLTGFHHCRYDRLGTPQELQDMMGVCDKCHAVLDALRQRAEKKRKRAEKKRKHTKPTA